MVELVGGDPRVVPVHEDRLGDEFPHRMTKELLRIVEIAVEKGEKSRGGNLRDA